jgi:hypothetical protein
MKIMRFLLCLMLLVGCDSQSPQDEYDDFVSRTASFRTPGCESTVEPADPDTDLSGEWLIRSRLGAGLALGLRIQFEQLSETNNRRYEVKFWLHDQPTDAQPLVVTETLVDETGGFTMIADPLDLGKDVVQSESAVLARVILTSGIIDADSWCGSVTGQVTSPLNLDLEGSTFYARRMGPDVTYETLPSSCPSTRCDDDIDGGSIADMGMSDAGPMRPESPSLDAFESSRTNLTGDWLMKASLAGLPLSLWITLYDRGAEDGGGLDGAVRLTRDEADTPPRINFFTLVDEDGKFDIWLSDLYLEIGPLIIEGDLLLSAVSQVDAWCGAGAGEIVSPFAIDLEGASFYAIPWVPGSPEPDEQPNACTSMDGN